MVLLFICYYTYYGVSCLTLHFTIYLIRLYLVYFCTINDVYNSLILSLMYYWL